MVIIGFVAFAAVSGSLYSVKAADYGSSAPHLAPAHDIKAKEKVFAFNGFLYNESSTVTGSGEISIKGSFHDHSVDSSGWMKGSGSINIESLRSMNKIGQKVDFTQKSDLVFDGGQLKNKKSMRLPLFEKGIGASVSERFNISHLDKSETDMIRSVNRFNNTMIYETALAWEGMWDIKKMRGWSINMNRSEEYYSGSFQIQKKIGFDDSAQT
jgi:hypothetical protein